MILSNCDGKKHIQGPNSGDKIINQLQEHGSDTSREHIFNFYLYFPEKESADKARDAIRDYGLQAKVEFGADNKNWLCLAQKQMIPDKTTLDQLLNYFESLAKSLNGEYDGWEASIVP